jgi:hypothetical protein
VVAHQLKLELKHRGPDFGTQYNALDVVFGGDHGARHFRAVVQLIFRYKSNSEVPTCSVTLQVGHFHAAKDTCEVIEKTIAKQLNEGLRRIVNKFALIDSVEHSDPTVIFSDEMPVANIINNGTHKKCVFFEVRAFASGDVAFYSTILGKPNMSPCWCSWCMLSKQSRNSEGHTPGEKQTIEKVHQIRHNVKFCGLKEEPCNIMGCTKVPLIDSVPIENYILSILHIIIGVGNSVLGVFYEWIEWRVEKLTQGK